MKVAIVGNEVVCAEVGGYYEPLRSTGQFRWSRKDKTMRARMGLTALDALASCCKLPPHIALERERLRVLSDAVEAQRADRDPKPIVPYPIKNAALMKHQIVGANMALLIFGAVPAEGGNACV